MSPAGSSIADRVKALQDSGLMDTPAVESFDRLTRLASRLLNAPVCLMCLVDEQRQFFKSAVGLETSVANEKNTAVDFSFCKYVVDTSETLIVRDAREHPYLKNNPAITQLGMIAYAGIPLKNSDGITLGSFCVIDRVPREWKPGEIGVLTELAVTVMTEMELQRRILIQRQLENRMACWMQCLPLACFVCDSEGRVQQWNAAATEVFGRTYWEMHHVEFTEVLFHSEFKQLAQIRVNEAKRGHIVSKKELRCLHKSGEQLICGWTLVPLHQEKEGCNEFIAIVENLTEEKKRSRHEQILQDRLRQTQKLEALGTLAGGIAHDFNNLIGIVLGNAELIRTDVSCKPDTLQSLNEIKTAARRGRNLIDRILAFSRSQPAERKPIHFVTAVEEALQLLRSALPVVVEIRLIHEDMGAKVTADPTQIHQIVLNLGTNAWHALNGKAGLLEIRIRPVTRQEINFTGDLESGNYVCLSVQDWGSGMDEKTQKRIFDPFFTTKPVGKGTGLGLAVVNGIVKELQGAIQVESQPEQGSKFSVYLPIEQESQQIEFAGLGHEAIHAGHKNRILYIDDEESMVQLATRTLGRVGYQVSGFTDPLKAIDHFNDHPNDFDLIMTDYHMPDWSGLDVAHRMLQRRPDALIAVISGFITEELQHTAIQMGIRHLLYKPSTVEELGQTVNGLLK